MITQQPIPNEPGIHPNIRFDVYLKIKAMNSSSLKSALKPFGEMSIPHMVAYMKNGMESTKAMRFGTLGHTGRLEPLKLMERYVVMPAYELDGGNRSQPKRKGEEGEQTTSKNTTYYKQKATEFKQVNLGKEVVEQKWWDMMLAMLTSMSKDKLAREYFECEGETELTIIWNDPRTGILCKGRIDKVDEKGKRLPDMKSTADIYRFRKQIFDLGYYVQQAFYADGFALLRGERYTPCLCAVESSDPYSVAAAPMSAKSLELGRRNYEWILGEYKTWQESGKAVGFLAPKEWELPPYAYEKEETTNVYANDPELANL